ncbi:hypothetical protein KIPB_001824 [Kipferlia bialata]|uniref:Importin subunit beta-1/Transportin-1-like TPR repeats domain-containing protein n=1 Tax=Kipferlia bialata TaxID=797122 RepID=A0A9K3CPG8_9EUKA|nr:hypothetical protein KIPB_001824 [Kipferlia bialata]|eukprot:g1824.t1
MPLILTTASVAHVASDAKYDVFEDCVTELDTAMEEVNSTDPARVKAALQVFLVMVYKHYGRLGDICPVTSAPYIEGMIDSAIALLSSTDEETVMGTVTVWSALALIEGGRINDLADVVSSAGDVTPVQTEVKSCHYVVGALDRVIDPLTQLLLNQKDELDGEDSDLVDVGKAALILISACPGAELSKRLLPFVVQNRLSEDWRRRDAALVAFSCTLTEDIQPDSLSNFVHFVCHRLQLGEGVLHPVERHTLSKVISQICHKHFSLARGQGLMPLMVQACSTMLSLEDKVAEEGCTALAVIANGYRTEVNNGTTHELVPILESVITSLLTVAERNQTEKGESLLAGAYGACGRLVQSCPASQFGILARLVPIFCDKAESVSSTIAELCWYPNRLEALEFHLKQERYILVLMKATLNLMVTPDLPGAVYDTDHWGSTTLVQRVNKSLDALLSRVPKLDSHAVLQTTVVLAYLILMCTESADTVINAQVSDLSAKCLVALIPHMDDPSAFDELGSMVETVTSLCLYLDPFRRSMHVQSVIKAICKCYENPHRPHDSVPSILESLGDLLGSLEDEAVQFLPRVMEVYTSACNIAPVDPLNIDHVTVCQACWEKILTGYSLMFCAMPLEGMNGPMAQYIPGVLDFCYKATQGDMATPALRMHGLRLLVDIQVNYTSKFGSCVTAPETLGWMTKLYRAVRAETQAGSETDFTKQAHAIFKMYNIL